MANGQERVADTGGQRKGQKKKDSNRKKRKQAKPQVKPSAPANAPLEKKIAKEQAPVFVPRINEPNPPCVICGKPIDAISQSIGGPQPETFSHFDCVLRKIADDEHILPTQKVSYIGRGTFAIIEVQADGKFTIIKRIPYENAETYSFMKKYVENQKN
jgi:hypothetical protein